MSEHFCKHVLIVKIMIILLFFLHMYIFYILNKERKRRRKILLKNISAPWNFCHEKGAFTASSPGCGFTGEQGTVTRADWGWYIREQFRSIFSQFSLVTILFWLWYGYKDWWIDPLQLNQWPVFPMITTEHILS